MLSGHTVTQLSSLSHFDIYKVEEMPKYRKTLRRQNEPEFAVYI